VRGNRARKICEKEDVKKRERCAVERESATEEHHATASGTAEKIRKNQEEKHQKRVGIPEETGGAPIFINSSVELSNKQKP